MSLRIKVLLVLACVMATSFVIGFAIMQSLVHPAFDELQSRLAGSDLSRVVQALESTARYMDTMGNEYAQWDDTYAFMQGKHPAYIEENLYVEFYHEFDLNFMFFYDLQARLVWGEILDVWHSHGSHLHGVIPGNLETDRLRSAETDIHSHLRRRSGSVKKRHSNIKKYLPVMATLPCQCWCNLSQLWLLEFDMN